MENNIEKANDKKQKVVIQKKGEFITVLSIGVVFLIAGMLLLFLWYRPFVHWVEIRVGDDCKMKILREYGGGVADIQYTFEYKGEMYEKIFYKIVHHGGLSGIDKTESRRIYINADNPLDAKPGMQGQPAALWLCIFFIGAGLLLVGFSLVHYLPKKNKKNKSKRRAL